MVSDNEAMARRFIDELWNEGDLRVADELVAAAHVHHVGDELLRGPDGVKGAVQWLREAFPDLRFEIEDLISDGPRVALRWTATGTHLGRFADLDPTGRHVTWSGCDWIRFGSGQITEVWAVADGGALYDQLTSP